MKAIYQSPTGRAFFKAAFTKENLVYDEDKLALLYEEFEVVYQ